MRSDNYIVLKLLSVFILGKYTIKSAAQYIIRPWTCVHKTLHFIFLLFNHDYISFLSYILACYKNYSLTKMSYMNFHIYKYFCSCILKIFIPTISVFIVSFNISIRINYSKPIKDVLIPRKHSTLALERAYLKGQWEKQQNGAKEN